ncbi:PKD-like domain-containing protein [Mucilaginibacter panaciglaebae]|uniref:IPT/TIG domain-containing protein n=1 Tax=Mucilaginibacter panaciglaebae TaxID=502331 RepID=A0ABP7WXM1_9SPHI
MKRLLILIVFMAFAGIIKGQGANAITAGTVTGIIITCAGTASADPNIEQFTVTASSLTNTLTATAPAGFEISLDPVFGYTTTFGVPSTPGLPGSASAIIYVRAAANAAPGNITGNVTLSSPGAATQNVAVSGTVKATPTVNQMGNISYSPGQVVPAITFTGTANSYNWVIDNPAIGTVPSGTNTIAQFTAINNGSTPIITHITVTPVNANGCNGAAMHFNIAVAPAGAATPSILLGTATGAITACMGVASVGPDIQQFTISGTNLTNDVVLTPTSNFFEISLASGTGYSNSITITPVGGAINTIIYVRSAATAPGGPLNGTVRVQSGSYIQNEAVNGTIFIPGNVNSVPNKTFVAGIPTSPINFAGTATAVTWTNDNTAIGLPAGGSGDIASFSPVNNTANDLVSTITVTPANPTGCNGVPIHFTIRVPAASTGPAFNISIPTGSINACMGVASVSPNIQQFILSGAHLTNDIVIQPGPHLEVSLTAANGYSNSLVLGQAAGTVPNTAIYIRSAATASAGPISEGVRISSGSFVRTIAAFGTINLPTI